MAQLKETLVKSPIGCKQDQKDKVKDLGLRKHPQIVIKEDNGPIRGTVFQ